MLMNHTVSTIGGTDSEESNAAATSRVNLEECNFLSRLRERKDMTVAEAGEHAAACQPPQGYRTLRVMRVEGAKETEFARLRVEHSGAATDYRLAGEVAPGTIITGWHSCGSMPFSRPGVLDLFAVMD
jgi:hypothetical protein